MAVGGRRAAAGSSQQGPAWEMPDRPAARQTRGCKLFALLISSRIRKFRNDPSLLKGKLVRGGWWWSVKCVPSPVGSPPGPCPLTRDLWTLASSFHTRTTLRRLRILLFLREATLK